MTKTEDLNQKYQKKTDIEHIKDAPDTYIGSIEPDEEKGWLLNEGKMINTTYNWVPGLYKCFDEGIVNARDHYVRLNGKKKDETFCHPFEALNCLCAGDRRRCHTCARRQVHSSVRRGQDSLRLAAMSAAAAAATARSPRPPPRSRRRSTARRSCRRRCRSPS